MPKKRPAPATSSQPSRRIRTTEAEEEAPSSTSTSSTSATFPSSPRVNVTRVVFKKKPPNQTVHTTSIDASPKQQQISEEIVRRLFKDCLAELIGAPGIGKTIMSGNSFSSFHATKKSMKRRGTTLVLSVSAEGRSFETKKCKELGSSNLTHEMTPSKQAALRISEELLKSEGICVMYLTQDAFQAWVKPFDKDSAPFITPLTAFVVKNNVTDLLLHIDEHQGAIAKPAPFVYGKAVQTIHSGLVSQGVKSKVKCALRFLFTSAKHRNPSKNSKAIRMNMEMLYTTLSPLPSSTPRCRYGTVNINELERIRDPYVIKLTEDDKKELLGRGSWKTGSNPLGGTREPHTCCILEDAGDSLNKEIILFSPLYAGKGDIMFATFTDLINANTKRGQYEVVVHRTVDNKSARTGNANRDVVHLSANIILACRKPYRIVEDCVQLLDANFNCKDEHFAWDTKRPKKQSMRKVTSVMPLTFDDNVDHFKCVLVVLNVKQVFAGLDKIRTYCMSHAEDTTAPTIIFNLIDMSADKLSTKMREIRCEFLKNERQVYMVTLCDQIVGSNEFCDFVDTVVTIGCDSRQNEQADGRTGGRPNIPYVGQVVPQKEKYEFFSVISKVSKMVIGDSGKKTSDASLTRMGSTKEYAAWTVVNNQIRDVLDVPEYQAYIRRFFYDCVRNGEREARPIETVFGNTGPTLCKEFLKLAKQRNAEQKLLGKADASNASNASNASSSAPGPFESRYADFVNSLAAMKLSKYEFDDDEEADFKVKDEVGEDVAELDDDDDDEV